MIPTITQDAPNIVPRHWCSKCGRKLVPHDNFYKMEPDNFCPGTGKSTILKAVIEAYRSLYPRKNIMLDAPTGKASRRMAETTGLATAQTLHSLLGLHGEDAGWQKKKPLEADLLIVDESSMMDMWLAYQLFARIVSGTKALLVGDAGQLESVGAGNVFHELINSGLVPVTVLNEVFRQAKDSLIAYNAKFINEENSNESYSTWRIVLQMVNFLDIIIINFWDG